MRGEDRRATKARLLHVHQPCPLLHTHSGNDRELYTHRQQAQQRQHCDADGRTIAEQALVNQEEEKSIQ